MENIFLTAEWKNLVFLNYEIEPELLQPYLPRGTTLDFFDGKCFVSVVGFLFNKTKLFGIPIPFHTKFEEVNLRFYVKYQCGSECKHGVSFIKEIAPKPATAFIANRCYGEHYDTYRMRHTIKEDATANTKHISYHWQKKKKEYFIKVMANLHPYRTKTDSEETFITEHYWAYTQMKDGNTSEYKVAHPVWKVHAVQNFDIQIDFAKVYGEDFAVLQDKQPSSVFLADGSAVEVFKRERLLFK
jgi:uncharacterized protein YqjF (DUF2071 family)